MMKMEVAKNFIPCLVMAVVELLWRHSCIRDHGGKNVKNHAPSQRAFGRKIERRDNQRNQVESNGGESANLNLCEKMAARSGFPITILCPMLERPQ